MKAPSIRILILEDDPNDVELVRSVLEQEGLGGEVAVARSLREFRSLLGQGRFQAVLSDYGLPQGSGLEALREVRAIDEELPVIIVSGTVGEEEAIEMLKLGATDYVLKHRLSRLGPALRRALEEREQRRLRRRAEQLRDRFYSISTDLFSISDRSRVIRDVNAAWVRMLGWSRAELIGRDMRELLHEEDREIVDEALAAVAGADASRRADARIRTRDGKWRWIQWTATYDADDQRVYSVGRDITELKRVHDELADRAQRQSLLAELGRSALREIDLDSLFARGARVVAEGCRTEFSAVLELSPDGRWLDLRATHGWPLSTPPPRIPAGHDSQSGFTLEIGGPVIVDSWARERRFRPPSLVAELGVTCGATVVIPGRKRPFGVLGVHSRERREFGAETSTFLAAVAHVLAEAVERRRYEDELRSTEDQLRHAQRMEALGMLAAGVAHDFNNVLTAILGYTELAAEDDVDAAQRKQYLGEVRAAADRAVGLSSQLLAFSRKQVRAPRVFDLSTVPRELERMLRRVIGEDVDLQLDLETAPLHVEADPSQIEQVLLNLAVNARDAMPDGGELRIETRAGAPDPARIVSGELDPALRYQRLSVVDSGGGMDAETLRRAFEPFFTTKPEGRGTGLGLPIVEKVVRQSRGAIAIETAPGRGTRFDIFLPEAVRPPLPIDKAAQRRAREGRGESVLVLDDDLALRRIVVQVLSKHGYVVTEAADVEEAQELAERRTRPFDLLLSDLVLERGTGPELSSTLASAGRVKRTLLMSGFMSHPIAERWLVEPGEKFLPKPFSKDQLLRAVRDALER